MSCRYWNIHQELQWLSIKKKFFFFWKKGYVFINNLRGNTAENGNISDLLGLELNTVKVSYQGILKET